MTWACSCKICRMFIIMYSYVLLFLCLYLLQHPACFLIRSLALARDDVVVDACDVLWVFTFNFRHKNIRTKGYIECSNVCSSKLDIPLLFQCLHLWCLSTTLFCCIITEVFFLCFFYCCCVLSEAFGERGGGCEGSWWLFWALGKEFLRARKFCRGGSEFAKRGFAR